MHILAVDDEQGALRLLTNAITKVVPQAKLVSFTRGADALEYCATQGCPDVAFLDIRVGSMLGLDIAKRLYRMNPRVNVIFCTGYDEYAMEALRQHASGYILKPVSEASVRTELSNLRFPVESKQESLYLKTFGRFECFFNDAPISFHYEKSREFLAVLFNQRGSMISNEALMAILWEDDDDHASYFRQIRKDLVDTLASINQEHILIRRRGFCGLDMDLVSSDYQEAMAGDASAVQSYQGSYMQQYSWAEDANAYLLRTLGGFAS